MSVTLRRLLFILLTIIVLPLAQTGALAQDERNGSELVEPTAADDSRSEDEEATDEDEAPGGIEFADIVAEIRDTDPAFGPDSGELEFDADGIAFMVLDDEYQDFLIDFTVVLPDLASDEIYEFGVAFRIHGNMNDPDLIQFLFDNSGSWAMFAGGISDFEDGSIEMLDSGIMSEFDDSAGAENTIQLLVQGGTVDLGLADEQLGSVEVPYDDAGVLMITAANYLDEGDSADPIEYVDLSIWNL